MCMGNSPACGQGFWPQGRLAAELPKRKGAAPSERTDAHVSFQKGVKRMRFLRSRCAVGLPGAWELEVEVEVEVEVPRSHGEARLGRPRKV